MQSCFYFMANSLLYPALGIVMALFFHFKK